MRCSDSLAQSTPSRKNKKKNKNKNREEKSLHKMENNITINQIRNATAYYCFIAEEVHVVGARDAQFMVQPAFA